ncbi:Twf1 protein [Candida orthopsilosis Co 90-125]|uniref:Twf1 protein n=1 Tax=Candida orthopsilosis (strain 90-125) TaxID=1136231 RepID=H8WZS0_CANO9|nr:Twf1 protein [Candida orthopsilosis Co 90-125]CCG22265.1 Twf1 protein [Candida orthopsilosis Co 90-125]
MSTQSGITVSEQLSNEVKNDTSTIIIKVSPDSTQLIPDTSFTQPSSTSLSSVFEQLHSYISKQYPQPVYIIIPYKSSKVFVSFIPDSAPIKQKMLYASTKNTLLSNLGSSSFAYKFAWTELDELSAEYLEKVINEDGESGPLTEDEKILQNLNNKSHMQGHEYGFKRELASMSSPSSSATSDILYKFDGELENEFQSLASDANDQRLLVFNIDLGSELIKLTTKDTNVGLNSLVKKLQDNSPSGPTYSIYNYSPNKYTFIYSCPSGSSVKDRMIYAASKNSLINHLKTYLNEGVILDKNLEVGDLDELELSELEVVDDDTPGSGTATPTSTSSSASANKPSNGLKFSKPKGPRRR